MATVPADPAQRAALIYPGQPPRLTAARAAVNARYLADETTVVRELLDLARLDNAATARVAARAESLVKSVRRNRRKSSGLDAFLQEYDLSSQEGVVLMCLAEALLRVPDADTADKLIRDKLASGNWRGHLGGSQSLFVNASTWGLMLTGRIVGPDPDAVADPGSFVAKLVTRAGEPVVRTAMKQAMRIMGHQFVMGRTIKEAMNRAANKENRAYRYSFDMLGEAALTAADATQYLRAYSDAIAAMGVAKPAALTDIFTVPSISVKLSALFPRYEFGQRARALPALSEALARLTMEAQAAGIGLTVDAEESERLDLSLEIFETVFERSEFAGWSGLGLAVQAYQRRGLNVVDWACGLARSHRRRIPLRLVKGAYWDTEIKRAQEQGLETYPVFTRKAATDVSYLACARKLLAARDAIYPQFATHNAHTVASIVEFAGDQTDFEFQRLHGMGEELYGELVGDGVACRVYAPVGNHEDLLPYLVRRLLENGANTSFVNRIVDERAPVSEIVADPVASLESLDTLPHPKIPQPADLFGARRRNSRGHNLADPDVLGRLQIEMQDALATQRGAQPLVGGQARPGVAHAAVDPSDHRRILGSVQHADAATAADAVGVAAAAQPDWDRRGGAARAKLLEATADLYEENASELLALCVREAGKSLADAEAEFREAVDFLRYYAAGAREEFAGPRVMPGPTGESNELWLRGRGIFVCISPWNFPLAIFTGQITAALAAGNAVIAKPAEQTPLVAARAVQLFHAAGVPPEVLNFIPGDGAVVGAALVADERVAGVAFTGSTETARHINRALAAREGPLPVLIAETGGQNAMLVDSSALPEQVVLDAVQSAFYSAGQRCSALRVLMLQEEIAPRVLELLEGYMRELTIGDPGLLQTDIGPVVDAEAKATLNAHVARMRTAGTLRYQCALPAGTAHGTFVAPAVIEIDSLAVLEREVFGPIMHVMRYRSKDLAQVIDAVNGTGYGLTLGIHSRVDSSARHIYRRMNVGNVYVNRNMVGAVVGVQPFGGCGLSGTGPKAGGPHYLHRFATERTVTINTAAVGGNTTLLSL